ncbi:hypothetical protein ANTHELSMS3_03814 [Antarctobacter heliothermus]|uniref:Phytanoyl-CoA dioxygenase (PhyH) n=1 Tax=Antarctobacter heliothermus TaxID=74033 RepID=A0A222E8A8_9RHOB|nr:hypothetical protein ANTHELSMS3_03814 [Antarctobacter heliothermus]
MGIRALEARGWTRFDATPESLNWVRAAHGAGRKVLADPAMRAKWLQCEGTWFVGVDVMPSAPDGSIDGVPLAGPAIDALSPLPDLHRAQLSVTYPGYPRPRNGESEAGFRYRLRRDAAHVDGIVAQGADRRRYILEPHAWILGLPLSEADPTASPLVVWEGSHKVMRAALRQALDGHPPEEWHAVDVTEVYAAARRTCFETCPRVTLPAAPGEAILLHRQTLHGIAPWQEGAKAPPEGRMMAYFRPQMAGGVAAWLQP